MSSLTMICATRNRPASAAELATVFAATVTGSQTRLLLACDADDPARPQYEVLQLPSCAEVVVQTARRFGPVLSTVAVAEAPHCDFIGLTGDDSLPRTCGWDESLMAALTAPGVAYGDDLLQGENLPTVAVITARIVTGLGYICPPGVQHLYLDDFWKRLGTDLGNLRYLPGVVMEHIHPVAGKRPWDEATAANNSPEQYGHDGAAFAAFLQNQWPQDLARLREALR